MRGALILDLLELKNRGKTVIYKESEKELNNTDWEFWGKRTTGGDDVFVYRKVVTFEEAEQFYKQELFN